MYSRVFPCSYSKKTDGRHGKFSAQRQARPQGCSGSAKMKPRSKGSAPPFLFDIGAERMKFLGNSGTRHARFCTDPVLLRICCSKLSLKNRVCTSHGSNSTCVVWSGSEDFFGFCSQCQAAVRLAKLFSKLKLQPDRKNTFE